MTTKSTSTATTMVKAMVFALAGAVLVFLLVGSLLAKQWRVETTARVDAEPARVAALVTDLATWEAWSAVRANLGPQTTTQVSGDRGSPGQTITWTGARGTGRLRLDSVAADAIEYVVESQGPGATAATQVGRGRIAWRADDGGCSVTWREDGQCTSLPERWFAWFGALQEVVRQMQVSSMTGLDQYLAAAPTGGAK